MNRYVRKRSQRIGLSPGSVVYLGDRRDEPVRMTLIAYDHERIEVHTTVSLDDLHDRWETPGIKWLNVDGVHDAAIVQAIGDRIGFHPLALEDVVSPLQRAKMDEYDDGIFVVVRMLDYVASSGHFQNEQVSLFLGPNFVISFQEREGDVFGPVRERIRGNLGRIRKMGADYLLFALLDVLVERYFTVLEAMGEEVERLEAVVIENPSQDVQARIRDLRGSLILVRRAAWPVRDVVAGLARSEHAVITPDVRLYLRDVQDNAVQVMDIIESLRDLVSGLQDLYMTGMSNRLNDVMKVLTIIGTIFIPLTFIAGVYGMNFQHMPELQLRWAYPVTLTLMAVIAISLIIYFRKRKWL